MRITVTGARGMLGSALMATAPLSNSVSGVDLPDGDLTSPNGAANAIEPHTPQVVIHCAALADVDGCTREPARAMLQNTTATANVAAVCRRLGARLVFISTDYVFDGARGEPYAEDDAPNPLNPYGTSKLAAEQAICETLVDYLIVRTQWLYGPDGRNFVATIVRKGAELGTLKVVADESGSPTYTCDLAAGLWELAGRNEITGILHLTGSGIATWAELARAALNAAGLGEVTVEPISRTHWPSPTVRPQYSALTSRRRAQLGLAALRPWQEAVREYVTTYLV